MSAELPEQVRATAAALQLIEQLRAVHGELMFHQSGGCCDGSAPMCLAAGDLLLGDADRLLGHIGGAPFYISQACSLDPRPRLACAPIRPSEMTVISGTGH